MLVRVVLANIVSGFAVRGCSQGARSYIRGVERGLHAIFIILAQFLQLPVT